MFCENRKHTNENYYAKSIIMNWIDKNIEDYYNFLKNKTYIKHCDTGWSCITTPFLGLFNDMIEIYIKQKGDEILLSDDGETLKNLDLLGVPLNSTSRKKYLDKILLNYGIKQDNGELKSVATKKNFPQKKHNIICAISEISDMEMTAKNTVQSIFKEDVKKYMDEKNIIYTPQFIAKGNMGLEFTFDFQIAGKEKELILKTFNSLNILNVSNFLFSSEDIKETRERQSGKELKSVAIINNENKDLKQEYLEVFKKKDADYILWTEREQKEQVKKLAA